jgi:hypothetical protein
VSTISLSKPRILIQSFDHIYFNMKIFFTVPVVVMTTSVLAFSIPSIHQIDFKQQPKSDHSYIYGASKTGNVRSPCPALNTLANHGYINRSGKNLTEDMIVEAISSVYKLDKSFAQKLSSSAIKDLGSKRNPGTLDLDALSAHDVIEHDASLTRFDAVQGDNHSFQPDLLHQILNISAEDTIGVPELGQLRTLREAQSLENGGKALSFKQNLVANGESALLLQAFGVRDPNGDLRAPKSSIAAWMSEERLPENWTPVNQITMWSSLRLSLAINGAKKQQMGLLQRLYNWIMEFGNNGFTFAHGSL